MQTTPNDLAAEAHKDVDLHAASREKGTSDSVDKIKDHFATTIKEFDSHVNDKQKDITAREDLSLKRLQLMVVGITGVIAAVLVYSTLVIVNSYLSSRRMDYQEQFLRREVADSVDRIRKYEADISLKVANLTSMEKLLHFYQKTIPDFILAQRYYSNGQLKEVLRIINDLLRDCDNDAKGEQAKEYLVALYDLKARVCLEMWDNKEASACAQYLIERVPERSIGYYHRGRIAFAVGLKERQAGDPNSIKRFKTARDHFQDAISKDSTDCESLLLRIWALLFAGERVQAGEELVAVEKEPELSNYPDISRNVALLKQALIDPLRVPLPVEKPIFEPERLYNLLQGAGINAPKLTK